MASTELPADFSAFLKLLNAHGVSFQVVGAYAVGFHGHPRSTADIDVWIPRDGDTSTRVVAGIREFGFDTPQLTPDLFLKADTVIRLGLPPIRIQLLTTMAGIEFHDCASRAVPVMLGGAPALIIGLADLKRNKLASGRHQDLADLEHLP
jgi:hypothetical protein